MVFNFVINSMKVFHRKKGNVFFKQMFEKFSTTEPAAQTTIIKRGRRTTQPHHF